MNLSPLLAELDLDAGRHRHHRRGRHRHRRVPALYMVFSRYTKVGPNQVLVVSGTQTS